PTAMSNPHNSSPPGTGKSANSSLTPPWITHGRSASHGSATVSSKPVSQCSDGDDNSISSEKSRKRDKIRNLFRPTKSEDKGKIQGAQSKTKIRHSRSAVSSLKVSSSGIGPQLKINKNKARLNIFLENVSRTSTAITPAKLDARIDNTSQLALCISLLPKPMVPSFQRKGLERASDPINDASQAMPTGGAEQTWVKTIEQNPVKKDHLRWLGSRIAEEFVKHAVKDPIAVSEVVLLGSVLDQAHYRKLLNCFIAELSESVLLDVDLLQGLVQLVQCAAPAYLDADDLVKILSILRKRLGDTHQQSSEHRYHLTLAVSRLLDVMADSEHKVEDLPRVEEREPLALVLKGLQTSSDPYLLYQALYAFQALQYVPDEESVLQAVMRHSLGVTESLIKVAGVIQLNLNGLFEGLKQMQKTVDETFKIAKSTYEGINSLIDSGRGLFDSLKDGLGSGLKLPWYPAVLTATILCRTGQLVDFNKLVREAPCRRDPRFQWGISQLLGEIAVDLEWESSIREKAVNFLGDLYLNDADWGRDESVKSWMQTILAKISEVPDRMVREAAQTLLQVLKKNGSTIITHPYPLRSHLPVQMSSPLLAIVQDVPYIEYDLNDLRISRLQEYNQTVYIPPQAKANLQASDKDTLPLMEKVKEFLESDGQVFLVLGDSGAGKSTFNRHLEHELWIEYKPGGHIPIFINLPAVAENLRDIIGEQLRIYRFSDNIIKELKENRKMILICDGYDETQLKVNLHLENMFNQRGQSDTKMIVSCRSTYLGQDYRDQFHPQQSDRYNITAANLYTEAVIVPFSRDQIEDYIDQFVRDPEVHKLIGDRPIWSTEDYMDKLRSIPNLMELVKNPFLLSLSLRALPGVLKDGTDATKIKVTRLTLYDSFIDQWLDISKRRLRTIKLSAEANSARQDLLEEGFAAIAIDFLKNLAAAIYKEQDGKPVVQYTPRSDNGTWKVEFFGLKPDIMLLRESSPLSRSGAQHRFLHRSLLEYFYCRHMYETARTADELSSVSLDLAEHPLSQKAFVKEPSIIQFLAEHAQGDSGFRERLHEMIERSKTDDMAAQGAANAITILVRAGVLFNGADLAGIKVPGADLSGGQFDSAHLQGADLTNTYLRSIWLRQADLSNAQMEDVQFGEYPYLKENSSVQSCAYSADGKALALGLHSGTIHLYNTSTWEIACKFSGHTACVTSVVFSPNGQLLVSGSEDKTVRLWDAQTGAPGAILRGHTHFVTSVDISPCGQYIASGSSDNTVRLWDARTGAAGAILKDHISYVTSIVFSPCGLQIASGSGDNTVQLWDAETGAPGGILFGHTGCVTSLAFSPNGQQIASGSFDKTVWLWDTQTGAPDAILNGHTEVVTSVIFSPSGQQIASSSNDCTVRLWDAQTGVPGAILGGHTSWVTSVVFSPCSLQIASGSIDRTVRLWDAQTGVPGAILSGYNGYVTSSACSPSSHTNVVSSVVFSPCGQQIASGSDDCAVRLWDAQTGAPGAILSGHAHGVWSVVFSPRGQQIASGGVDNTVRLWDAQTGSPGAILSGHTEQVTSVAFSPISQHIASSSGDHTVRLWDAQTGEPGPILHGHTNWVASVVFSPCGQQIASGSYDKTVRLWDAQTGSPGAILSGHMAWVSSAVFSPSGQLLASGSEDGTIRLWDVQTGAPRAILSGHAHGVRSVVFSPSGQQIASGSEDQTVRLWDVDSGQCLVTIKDFRGVIKSVAWNASADGSYLATGCSDKSVRMWKVDGACHSVHLLWSSVHDQLVISDANIWNTQGLSGTTRKLLEQRGAVSKSMYLKEP
ncbi:hypothetical protein BGZ72_007844, partial [Mortierella alpina]